MRYLQTILFALLTLTAQAQTDSVRTEYKTEDESISKSEVKRFIRYVTRANVEEKTLIKVGIWPATINNNITATNRRLQFGLNADFAVEQKLTPSFSMHVGLATNWQYTEFESPGILNLYAPMIPTRGDVYTTRVSQSDVRWKLGLRYYHSMAKRIRTGRSANNFSGNYIAIQALQPILSQNGYKSYNVIDRDVYTESARILFSSRTSLRLSLQYGIQRRLGKRGYFDVNAGPEIYPRSLRQTPNLSFQVNIFAGLGL